jgi:polygalacturonase
VRHVLVQDLSMEGSVSGLRIKSDVSRGGLVSDVLYRDVCLRDVATPITLDTHYTANARGGLIPQFSGITLQQVHSLTMGRALLRGYDAEHALDVNLDDVAVEGARQMDERSAEFVHVKGYIEGAVGQARKAECDKRLLPFSRARNLP